MFKVSPSARSALSRRHRRLAPHLPQDVLGRTPSSAGRVSVEPHLPQDNVSVEPHLPQDVSQSIPIFRWNKLGLYAWVLSNIHFG